MKNRGAGKDCRFSSSEKRGNASFWSQFPKSRRTHAGQKKVSHVVVACLLILATVFLYSAPVTAVAYAEDATGTPTMDASVTAGQTTSDDSATTDQQEAQPSEDTQGSDAMASEEGSQNEAAPSKQESVTSSKKSKAATPTEDEAQSPSLMNDDGTVVCKIGSNGYTSLKEAVADAKDGDTIVMVDDETQTETIVIPAGKSLTIKDDGKKRTVTAGEKSLFKVEGTLTIDGSNLVLDGGKATSANIADVTGTLNMKDATVNGGTYTTLYGILYMHDGGIFNLSGGAIQNTIGDNWQWSGVIRVGADAIMNMTGGEIRNNKCNTGSGICAVASMGTTAADPIVNISGGKISGNEGLLGTAVMGAYHADIHISGGEISGNLDNDDGTNNKAPSGTIHLSKSKLTITGGVIKNNKARSGGAIYAVGESEVKITACEITGNEAKLYGGAIFLDDARPTSYIENCVVSGNSASSLGGGVWCCPTGTAKVCATEGMAIFDNTATNAGDDFTNLRTDKQAFAVELSERMLGGGLENYYVDGGLKMVDDTKDPDYWHGLPDNSVPRYAEGSEKFDVSNSGDGCLALKALPTDGAKASANKHAKVIISGNTATYGGGIACNGSLFSGQTEEEPDVWSLKVNKVWKDVAEEDQKEVEIALVIDGEEVDTVKLNKDNNWEATFENLPDPETLNGSIEVVEKTTGFEVEYSEITSEDTTMSVTVTNSPEPEYDEPPVPEDEPPTPDEPDHPKTDNPKPQEKVTTETTTKKVTKTGDERGYALYVVLGVLALGAAVSAVAVRRRTR